ncbi:hypothetical protein PHLCEN_2v3010, partial [Hermanssonia centrifuga]
TYVNGIAVKSTTLDPRWTILQQVLEEKVYEELRHMATTVSWTTPYDPSKPFSKFWDAHCEDLVAEFEPRLKLEVQRVKDCLELYEIEGEWNGCRWSKEEVKEEVYSRVRIVACLHEVVDLLREGKFDQAHGDHALVYFGR